MAHLDTPQEPTTTPKAPASADPHLRRLGRGFAGLTVLTYGLIVLGALVRANGAGLACPDWPLCFGDLVPTFDVKVAFEWSHRAVAGTVGILFLGLSVAVLRRPAGWSTAGAVLVVSAALLALQILLGALTVWELLASWTVTSHLLTGNAFAVGLLLTSRSLSESGTPVPRAARHADVVSARIVVGIACALLAIQMTLGGLVSSNFAGTACPDWPTCMDGHWFPTFRGGQGYHVMHRLVAYALLAALALGAWSQRRTPQVGTGLALALALGVAQVGVGIANVLMRVPIELTGLHSALAAALVLTLAAVARSASRLEAVGLQAADSKRGSEQTD